MKCKPYSEIRVEIGTQLKTVKITSNIFAVHLKQTFPPIIWIFTEGEGDGIKSRLPFKIFSILTSN